MARLQEERGASKLYLNRFEDRQLKPSGDRYRDGNTVALSHGKETLPRLTLGQLTRHLVNHGSVMDHVDVLTEIAYRDARRHIRLHLAVEASKRGE